VYIRDKNSRGQEISGYIDYANRLKTDDFEAYFAGRKRFLPKSSDLRCVVIGWRDYQKVGGAGGGVLVEMVI